MAYKQFVVFSLSLHLKCKFFSILVLLSFPSLYQTKFNECDNERVLQVLVPRGRFTPLLIIVKQDNGSRVCSGMVGLCREI